MDVFAIVRSQMLAGLAMLDNCLSACPEEHWDAIIGTYPFWHVAYHTLCYVDCYLSPDNEAFTREVESRATWKVNPQPTGMAELEGEFPSRLFTKVELRWYADFCREKARRVLGEETPGVLEGSSGFSWLKFSRAELHLYNIRHLAHHTGQLTASLRRIGVETKWAKDGRSD